VLNDWQTDRVVASTYPPRCYGAALRHLPTDVRSYSDAGNVIQRAMLDAIRNGPTRGGGAGTTVVRGLADVPPASANGVDPIPAAAEGGVQVPIPILILLGCALLLLGVGGVGKLRAHFAGQPRK